MREPPYLDTSDGAIYASWKATVEALQQERARSDHLARALRRALVLAMPLSRKCGRAKLTSISAVDSVDWGATRQAMLDALAEYDAARTA